MLVAQFSIQSLFLILCLLCFFSDILLNLPNGSGNLAFPPYIFHDNPNLEWKSFEGSLPIGAVGIHNDYTKRQEYVCRPFLDCGSGFYHEGFGDYCIYPSYPDLAATSLFYVLVNKDDFEFLEWESGSYGSVGKNSVRTCMDSSEGLYKEANKYYVGKNKYGLGFVKHKDSFYLPWVEAGNDLYGYSDWYRQSHKTLTINSEKYEQEIKDIVYATDQAKVIDTPPYAIKNHIVQNQNSGIATMTAKLETTQTKTNSWQFSSSLSISAKTEVKAGLPFLVEQKIEIGIETTFGYSKENSFSESRTSSLEVGVSVPANSQCKVTLQGRKYTSDVPFKARLERKYRNGVIKSTSLYGTYKGVEVGDYRGVVGNCEPLAL